MIWLGNPRCTVRHDGAGRADQALHVVQGGHADRGGRRALPERDQPGRGRGCAAADDRQVQVGTSIETAADLNSETADGT